MVTTNVASFRPYDVTQFKSRDAAAAVLLAHSLGWRVITHENGPVSLVAEDGKQIRVPDNTGIKMSVFRGWIHQIAVHSDDQEIDRLLVDQIVKATKLNREHANLMYQLIEDALPDDFGPVEEPEVGTPSVANDPLPRAQEPYILTREEYVNTHGKKTGSCYVRTWSDGHEDYECTICTRAYDTIKGVGAHRQWHIGRGEIEGREIQHRAGRKYTRSYDGRTTRVKPPPEPITEPMIEVPEAVMTDAISALKLLDQIKRLLGAEEVEQLRAQLATRDERIAHLEGNLKALRDLLGDV